MEQMLAQTDGFKNIPSDGLRELVDRGQPRTFPKGSELMHQGDIGDVMYMITSGRVRVQRSHPDLTEPLVLAELSSGDVVGEMGLLDGNPRSATVEAIEDTETVELTAGVLSEVIIKFPTVSGTLLRLLTRRLRSTDELAEEISRRQVGVKSQ